MPYIAKLRQMRMAEWDLWTLTNLPTFYILLLENEVISSIGVKTKKFLCSSGYGFPARYPNLDQILGMQK